MALVNFNPTVNQPQPGDPRDWISELTSIAGAIGGYAIGGPTGSFIGGALGGGLGRTAEYAAKGQQVDPQQVLAETALGGIYGWLPAKSAQTIIGRTLAGDANRMAIKDIVSTFGIKGITPTLATAGVETAMKDYASLAARSTELGLTKDLVSQVAPKKVSMNAIDSLVKTPDVASLPVLRGTTKLTEKDITAQMPNIKTKVDIPVKTAYGEKVVIPKATALTPYEIRGSNVLLQDGEAYLVSKSQFNDIKGRSLTAEAIPFAPELKRYDINVAGYSPSFEAKANKMGYRFNRKMDTWVGPDNKPYSWQYVAEKIKINKMSSDVKYRNYTTPPRVGETVTQGELLLTPKMKNYIEERRRADIALQEGKITQAQRDAIVQRAYEKERFQMNKAVPSHAFTRYDIFGWMRYNLRQVGNKLTFNVEEVQSDWAKNARKYGVITERQYTKIKRLEEEHMKLREQIDKLQYEIDATRRTAYKGLPKSTVQYLRSQNRPILKPAQLYDVYGLSPSKLHQKRLEKEAQLIKQKDQLSQQMRKINNDWIDAVKANPDLNKWIEMSVKQMLIEAAQTDATRFMWSTQAQQVSFYPSIGTRILKVTNDSVPNAAGQKVFYLKNGPGYTDTIKINRDGIITSGVVNGKDATDLSINQVFSSGILDAMAKSKPGQTISLENKLEFAGAKWAQTLYEQQISNIVKKLTGQEIKYDKSLLADRAKSQRNPDFAQLGYQSNNKLQMIDLFDSLAVGDTFYPEAIKGLDSSYRYFVMKSDTPGVVKVIKSDTLSRDDVELLNGLIVDARNLRETRAWPTYKRVILNEFNKVLSKKEYADYVKSFTKKDIEKVVIPANQPYIELTKDVKNMILSKAPEINPSGIMFTQEGNFMPTLGNMR